MKKVKFNVGNWSYQDFLSFQDELISGNFHNVLLVTLPCIVGWDFDAEISEEGLDHIPFDEQWEAVQAITEALNNAIEATDTHDVEVDLSRWIGVDYERYKTVAQPSRTRKPAERREAETLLKKVARFVMVDDEGEKTYIEDEHLTAGDGMVLDKAVGEAISKMFRKKRTR